MAQFPFIVGLGNPGSEYEKTYHNAGFLFLDYLADHAPFEPSSGKEFEFARIPGMVLVKPLSFMNLSGQAVVKARSYLNLGGTLPLVVHDDSDLTLGEFKLSSGQGAAGHRGVQSVIDALGTQDFWRLRIGIRPKIEQERRKAGDFVLKPLSKSDLEKLYGVFGGAKEKLMLNDTPLASG